MVILFQSGFHVLVALHGICRLVLNICNGNDRQRVVEAECCTVLSSKRYPLMILAHYLTVVQRFHVSHKESNR